MNDDYQQWTEDCDLFQSQGLKSKEWKEKEEKRERSFVVTH